MATASFVFTTPVAQPQQVGVLLGSPVTLDLGAGLATVPYVGKTATAAIPGTEARLVVALTAADFDSIMAIIIARAQANGAAIPAGAVTVG
jgi:hypothetical protein